MVYELNSIQDERVLRLDALEYGADDAKKAFLEALKDKFKGDGYHSVLDAYKFAVNIEYDHVGLSSDTYLIHPLRVAGMVIALSRPLEVDYVIIALLHNILEVGGVEIKELEHKFGKRVAISIQVLTVDRQRQWEQVYKEVYYHRINGGYKGMQIVKVLDKLDNIFLLGLNKDEGIRAAYLDEIEKYIIPIAETVLPNSAAYIKNVSDNARAVGYFSR